MTHSLTGVWTLGRLEAGCFYFHVLQHNIVYKMDRWEKQHCMRSIAPPFLLCRGEAAAPQCAGCKDRPGLGVSESPTAGGHLCATGSEWDLDVVGATAQTRTKIPGFLSD